ncbi:MAG TPA: cupredoxin domain-containing protein [Nitrospira sp.]|nr:cupredoxin domain-containing protein [Nitrospira sp.]
MPVRARYSLVLLLGFASTALVTPTSLGMDHLSQDTAVVVIQGRQFIPARTVLHRGRRTTLSFKNQDAELHAVMPYGLFAGMTPSISGNSAVEFEGEGFKRVIIPPDGVASFEFTPTAPGDHRYICDMPGHNMHGIIAVE